MARPASPLVEWAQYAALRVASSLTHSFSVEQNLRTAAGAGRLFYRFSSRHRRRAQRHLAASFPHWTATQVRDTARRSVEHMFQLFMVDAIAMPRLLSNDGWPDRIHFGDVRPVVDRLVRQQPTIFLTGHCGNWEVLGFTLAAMGFPMYALARPLDNRPLNRWLLSVRQARGLRVITKWGATPLLQWILDTGGRVGFIADQNAGDQGLFVPFFGRLASSYKSIGLLAMHHRVPIMVGAAMRRPGRFEFDFHLQDVIEPHEWASRDDPLFYVTARYNRALEVLVRSAPEQYLWVHRRWKSRPRHERQGRPMPRRLIDRLRALPWMTDSELDQLVHSSNPSPDPATVERRNDGAGGDV